MTELIDDLKTKEPSGVTAFARSIRSGVYGLWAGHLDLYHFIDTMRVAIERGFNRAWEEGSEQCGVRRSEWTIAEFSELRYQIASDVNYLINYAYDIEAGSRANGGKLGAQYTRAELWINRYWAIVNLAKTMACADQKMEWVYGDTIRHCSDCSTYAGRVYRNSIWDKYGIRPQLHSLACGGWRCHCDLVPTDKPANRGKPPAIKGV